MTMVEDFLRAEGGAIDGKVAESGMIVRGCTFARGMIIEKLKSL
jgi:hypothetical protein